LKKRTSINSIPKFHKEKEMADFRKMFYALAIVALIACFTVPASAQTLLCTSLTATNQTIRVEGWSELVGDILLGCQGTGGSTAPGQPIAAANIRVTIPATQISSKLLNPSAHSSTQLSEATLIMDDLKDPTVSSAANFAGSRPHLICNDTLNGSPGVCQVLAPATPNLSYDGTCPGEGTCRPNIFVGRPVAGDPSSVIFAGVPLDPPGTGFTRSLRITNIRVNATTFDPTNPFQQVIAVISIEGQAAVVLNSTQTTVATVAQGMGKTTVTADNTFLQCEYPTNTLADGDLDALETHGWTTDPDDGDMDGGDGACIGDTTGAEPCIIITPGSAAQPVISIKEGFRTGWKPRNMSELLGTTGVVVCGTNNGVPCNGGGDGNDFSETAYTTYNGLTINNNADIPQDNPQVRFFTEGGYSEVIAGDGDVCTVPSGPTPTVACFTNGGTGTPGTTIAYGLPGGTYPNGATGGGAGTADWGTRIQFTISSIPNGATLSLPTIVQLMNGSTVSGVMVMITPSTANGKGAFVQTGANSALASLLNTNYFDLTGPSATVTYEVLMSDPFSIETANVYPVLYYPPNSLPTSITSDLPQANVETQVTVATFAPYLTPGGNQSNGGQVNGTPRFVQTTGPLQNLLSINRCTCSLLFPWVVSDSNYVTGIAVANTSSDPTNALTPAVFGYTAAQQNGTVQLYLFGTIGGLTAQTNTSIAAVYPGSDTLAKSGSYATFIVNTGFAGYAITQANFQYCHGLAFLFNATGAVPPVSYLGLTMDHGSQLSRTNQLVNDGLVH